MDHGPTLWACKANQRGAIMGQPYAHIWVWLGLNWFWFGPPLNTSYLVPNSKLMLSPCWLPNVRIESLCLIEPYWDGSLSHLTDQIGPNNQGLDQLQDPLNPGHSLLRQTPLLENDSTSSLHSPLVTSFSTFSFVFTMIAKHTLDPSNTWRCVMVRLKWCTVALYVGLQLDLQ